MLIRFLNAILRRAVPVLLLCAVTAGVIAFADGKLAFLPAILPPPPKAPIRATVPP